MSLIYDESGEISENSEGISHSGGIKDIQFLTKAHLINISPTDENIRTSIIEKSYRKEYLRSANMKPLFSKLLNAEAHLKEYFDHNEELISQEKNTFISYVEAQNILELDTLKSFAPDVWKELLWDAHILGFTGLMPDNSSYLEIVGGDEFAGERHSILKSCGVRDSALKKIEAEINFGLFTYPKKITSPTSKGNKDSRDEIIDDNSILAEPVIPVSGLDKGIPSLKPLEKEASREYLTQNMIKLQSLAQAKLDISMNEKIIRNNVSTMKHIEKLGDRKILNLKEKLTKKSKENIALENQISGYIKSIDTIYNELSSAYIGFTPGKNLEESKSKIWESSVIALGESWSCYDVTVADNILDINDKVLKFSFDSRRRVLGLDDTRNGKLDSRNDAIARFFKKDCGEFISYTMEFTGADKSSRSIDTKFAILVPMFDTQKAAYIENNPELLLELYKEKFTEAYKRQLYHSHPVFGGRKRDIVVGDRNFIIKE